MTETIAEFTFAGVTERCVISQGRDGKWQMKYCRVDGYPQASISDARSRAEIIQQTKRFMIGHGQCLMFNLIQSAEKRGVA